MIRKKRETGRPVIDLTGPEGNAYVLMGYAARYAKQLGKDSKSIISEMQQSDYENLVQVFDKHFGDYVILER